MPLGEKLAFYMPSPVALPKYMCFYPAPVRVLYVLLIPTYTHI